MMKAGKGCSSASRPGTVMSSARQSITRRSKKEVAEAGATAWGKETELRQQQQRSNGAAGDNTRSALPGRPNSSEMTAGQGSAGGGGDTATATGSPLPVKLWGLFRNRDTNKMRHLHRLQSNDSAMVARSVRGAGWDDPAFGDDMSPYSTPTLGGSGRDQKDREKKEDAPKQNGGSFRFNLSTSLFQMGSSTNKEQGSDVSKTQHGKKKGKKKQRGPEEKMDRPDDSAVSGDGLSAAHSERYLDRAYRTASLTGTYEDMIVPSTVSTGLPDELQGTSRCRGDSGSSVGLSNLDDVNDDYVSVNGEGRAEGRNFNTKCRRDDRVISWTKLAVLAVLGAGTVVAAVLMYRLGKSEEQDDFRVKYNDLSAAVMAGFQHNMDMKVWSAYTLSQMYAHEGSEHGDAWPNVTLPDFYEQVEGILLTSHAGTESMSFSPIVHGPERKAWEAYAAQAARFGSNEESDAPQAGASTPTPSVWEDAVPTPDRTAITQSGSTVAGSDDLGAKMIPIDDVFGNGRRRSRLRRRRGLEERPRNKQQMERTIEDGIFRTEDGVPVYTENEQDFYLPILQTAPKQVNKHHVMYDLRGVASSSRAIDSMIYYHRPTLTDIYSVNLDPFIENSLGEPSAILFHPIFKDYCGYEVVGAISTVFTIGAQIAGLPENVVGMTCVIETNSGQKFTYNLDGGGYAQLVGEGDLHETKYDSMLLERSFDLQSYHVYDHDEQEAGCARRSQEHNLEEGMPLPAGADQLLGDSPTPGFVIGSDNDGERDPPVVMTVKIYPSSKFKDQNMTRNPATDALVVSLIFLVTSATFLIYDCLVQKRTKTAAKSTKNVDNNEEEGHGHAPTAKFVSQDDDKGGHIYGDARNDDNNDFFTLKQGDPTGIKTIDPTKGCPSIRGFNSNYVSRSDGGLSITSSTFSGIIDDVMLGTSTPEHHIMHGPPVADLFTDTTIMFADIAGFTAWSSEREPIRVFQLLEALYNEFDRMAKSAGVFKVETIGDCYVAVAGLPNPQPDHAMIMCDFAQKCLRTFNELAKELELSLGPGTGGLGLRVGIHSGPVTAGVLRGERARFQLFGNTMNTASRMESTSLKNMVQISQSTADALALAGRSQMFIPREGLVQAQGKGEVQTYWLCSRSARSGTGEDDSQNEKMVREEQEEDQSDRKEVVGEATRRFHSNVALSSTNEEHGKKPPFADGGLSHEESSKMSLSPKRMHGTFSNADHIDCHDEERALEEIIEQGPSEELLRLVKWNTAVLERFLTKVVNHDDIYERMCSQIPDMKDPMKAYSDSNEAAEVIPSPWFDREASKRALNRRNSTKSRADSLPEAARRELHEYVLRIAMKYESVNFHAFEHASHVTMSANKLMNKICSREFGHASSGSYKKYGKREREVDLFFSTFGIACDPLAQLAVVFAALVHDVEHTGVPNARLSVENPVLARRYNNKSVAEQNSAHVAWGMLMGPDFLNLRRCMFTSTCNRDRFLKMLINVLIATDIADRERISKEKVRWQKAFEDLDTWKNEWKGKSDEELAKVDVSAKATCVLEQIVLASDVAHTMQHWLTFVKWNERLYRELWVAYKSGRAQNDPTLGWYESQIGFYDGYIIPLATKLKECDVFGNAGDEYLGNALSNKQEWIEKGREISKGFDETIKFAEA